MEYNIHVSHIFSAQTTDLIKRAVDIKATGVESAFNKEFQQMEENLDEIRQIVRNANISSEDIRDLDSMLKSLRQAFILETLGIE